MNVTIRRKNITTAMAVAAAAALTLGAAPATQASDTQSPSDQPAALSAQDEQQLRDNLAELGVEGTTQDELVASWEAGEMWDSLDPQAEPVREDQVVVDGAETTRQVYADGSVAELQADSGAGPVQGVLGGAKPMGISGCQTSSSAYHYTWKGCKANVNLGVISMGFYYDRESVRDSHDKITRAWGNHHHCVGCSLSGHRIEKFSDRDYRYSTDLDVAFKGFPVGWTAYMGVKIANGAASTYNN